MRFLPVLAVAACARLPHVDPQPRTPRQQTAAVARVDVACAADDFDPWSASRTGTGVVISERHILTAAHVVRCPTIAQVWATLDNGRRLMMVVERDDSVFGEGTDVARLEIASADSFRLGLAPPRLDRAGPGSGLFASVRGGQQLRGMYRGHGGLVDGMVTRPGDSGAPVYDAAGALVGIVIEGDSRAITRYYPIDERWLEGT